MASPALVLLCVIALAPASGTGPASEPPVTPALLDSLAPGIAAERSIGAGEAQSWAVAAVGRPLLVTVDQHGIDLAVAAFGPDGGRLADVDSPNDREGQEALFLAADLLAVGQTVRIEVRDPGLANAPGRYAIRLEELELDRPEGRGRAEAERLRGEANRQSRLQTAEGRRVAVDLASRALGLFRQLGRRREEAEVTAFLAELHLQGGGAGLQRSLELDSRALALWRELGEPGREAESLSRMGLCRRDLGEAAAAVPLFEQALALYRAHGDGYGEAGALNNLCLMRHAEGALHEALDCYERALALCRDAGAPQREMSVLVSAAGAEAALGEPQAARRRYEAALGLARRLGDLGAEARALSSLSLVERSGGRLAEALDQAGRALALFRRLGDRSWEARTLTHLGWFQLSLGRPERALPELEAALALRREAGDRRGEAVTLHHLGRARADLGEKEAALELGRAGLAAARAAGDRAVEADVLELLGSLLANTSRPADRAEGRAGLEAALAIRRDLGHRPGEAAALQLLGELDLAAGEPAAARDRLAAALDLQRAIGLPLGEARSLAGLAAAERRLGRLEAARGRFEEAVGVIESLRAAVAAPDQRAAFLSTQRRTFEQYLDLLLDLHRSEPAGGWAAAALELHERSRARGLLDLLQESGADLRGGVDPELDRREQEVLQRLNAKAQRRAEAPAGAAGEARRRALEGEAAALLAELDRLETEIRRQSPRYAAVTPRTPLRAAEVQALIDPGTLLLEYSLGEERSALWAVSDDALELHELPGREAIEAAVRRGLATLRTVAVGEAADAGGDLVTIGRLLLGPVAGRLDRRRLVVVPDGILEMLPFAALPEPGAVPGQREDPLVVRHEIAYLPSASVLAALRREPAPPPAERTLAVLADPVFDRRDPRVAGAILEGTVISAGAAVAPPPALPATPTPDVMRAGFARLPGSRREAEAIATLVEPRQARVLLDFQASRRALLAGALAGSRILHLATHGVIDTRTPELSGLVLSLVDERGAPQDGFLGLRDVFGLRLDAELVVLSGCETALGKELRGEGLMGLTRGFLYAGARRVAASLWRVQDRATAELMTRFYQGLLARGLPPAAALREAQLALLGDRRFAAPAHWAPFIVVGDWRPAPREPDREAAP